MSIAPLQTNSFENFSLKANVINNNTTYPQTKPQQNDTVELSKQNNKVSNKTKIGIGLGIAAAATAIVLVAKGKFKTAKNTFSGLAEHIEFSPAKTVDEAVNFAKTKLGIRMYDNSMPVEVMNWVNEGLVNINNATKGKAKLFDSIGYQSLENKTALACAVSPRDGKQFGAICNINKDCLENLDEIITKAIKNEKINVFFTDKNGKINLTNLYKNGEASEALLEKVNRYNENPKNFTITDKIDLFEGISALGSAHNSFFKSPMTKLKDLLNNEKVKNILTSQSKLPDLEQIEKLSTIEQIKTLIDTTTTCIKSGIKFSLSFDKGNKFNTIYHEAGHLQHEISAGYEKYNLMGKAKECIKNSGKVSDITNDFLNSKEKQQIANRISAYASESPREFVAETYSKLIANNGKKLPDEIMNLYTEYLGPLVN